MAGFHINVTKRIGVFIVLVGPDGAGKTTIIRGLMEQIEAMGYKVLYFHGRPPVIRTLSDQIPDPGSLRHHLPSHNEPSFFSFLFSFVRLSKNLIHYNLGYWLRVYPELKRGTIVIADRYSYWYLIDPPGTSYFGPTFLVELFIRLVPQPDLILIPWAPPELIFSRKPELEISRIAEQMGRCDGLASRESRCIRIDTTGPLENTIFDVVRVIRWFIDDRGRLDG